MDVAQVLIENGPVMGMLIILIGAVAYIGKMFIDMLKDRINKQDEYNKETRELVENLREEQKDTKELILSLKEAISVLTKVIESKEK